MELWIARDKNTELFLYNEKPVREKDTFMPQGDGADDYFYTIDFELFPEVTWENSPMKVELNLIKNDYGFLDC